MGNSEHYKLEKLPMAVAVVLCIWLVPIHASHAEQETLPTNHVSMGFGFPIPVGGIAKVELLHRLDVHNFVKVGLGSAIFLNSIYLSYGRRFSDDPDTSWYAYGGLENTFVLVPMGGTDTLPGIHAGLGKEWYTDAGTRIAFGLAIGAPWLGGLTFEYSL